MSKKRRLHDDPDEPSAPSEGIEPPSLPGRPGYRTRSGSSGLDPIESNLEMAFMEGTFYRRLFTGKLRTRKPVYLALMVVAGSVLILPLVATLVESKELGRLSSTIYCSAPPAIAGAALLVNWFINLGESGRLRSIWESLRKWLP